MDFFSQIRWFLRNGQDFIQNYGPHIWNMILDYIEKSENLDMFVGLPITDDLFRRSQHSYYSRLKSKTLFQVCILFITVKILYSITIPLFKIRDYIV